MADDIVNEETVEETTPFVYEKFEVKQPLESGFKEMHETHYNPVNFEESDFGYFEVKRVSHRGDELKGTTKTKEPRYYGDYVIVDTTTGNIVNEKPNN